MKKEEVGINPIKIITGGPRYMQGIGAKKLGSQKMNLHIKKNQGYL